MESITDMAFVDGKLFVAGLSNEEFASKLRVRAIPVRGGRCADTSVEIYHGNHGQFETRSPVIVVRALQDWTTADTSSPPTPARRW